MFISLSQLSRFMYGIELPEETLHDPDMTELWNATNAIISM